MEVMTLIRLLSLCLCLFQGAHVWAGCEFKDFSAKLGPVRNQGSRGWCFAFTAADLLGYKLGITPAEQISAFDVASAQFFGKDLEGYRAGIAKAPDGLVKTYMTRRLANLTGESGKPADCTGVYQAETGSLFSAISSYQSRSGYCMESVLPSMAGDQTDIGPAFQYLNSQITDMVNNMNRERFGASQCNVSVHQLTLKSAEHTPLWCSMNSIAQSMVETKIGQICASRTPFPSMNVSSFGSKDQPGRKMFDQLDGLIEKEIPVALSFDACFLMMDNCTGEGDYEHMVSIVGHRPSSTPGECEYKIRNSWGTDCSGYNEEFRANCKNEPGYVWLTESQIRANLTEFSYLN